MGSVTKLLSERMNKGKQSAKMAAMAKESASGNRSSFSGLFSTIDLNQGEKDYLEAILYEYSTGSEDLDHDYQSLETITSEVKAINNQAALLHGERIKQAQKILKRYHEGAFTAWLIAAYGNRQTPYNFLLYFEFFNAMPKQLKPQIEAMPRQAVYTLASREGEMDKKQQIVKDYNGETKNELLYIIREIFPLDESDKRKRSVGATTITSLERLCATFQRTKNTFTKRQKRVALELINELYELIEGCKQR